MGALRDMRKFYESVDLGLLRDRMESTGFPKVLARVLINLWRGPRAIKIRTAIDGTKHFARSGLPAGSTFADLAVMVYTAEGYDWLCAKWPLMQLTVYVDDHHVASTGSEEEVVATVVGATQDLEKIVVSRFRSSFAHDKSTHVATSNDIASRLNRLLCGGRGQHGTAVENLGIDFQVGARRASARGTCKRKQRMTRFRDRLRLVRRMRDKTSKGKDRVHGIARAGARPMASFGNGVVGFTDAELNIFRRRMASTAAPTARCSLTAKLAAIGDPAGAEAVGPAVAWAAEVWRTATKDARSLDIRTLAKAWAKAADQQGGWNRSTGPARRCILTLRRVGWGMKSPFTFIDDRGHLIDSRRTSPALVQHLLREGNQRQLERDLGGSLWPEEGRRACMGTVHRAISPTAGTFDAIGKGIIRCCTAGAYWTAAKRRAKGHDVPDVCPLCGLEGDTLHHGLWICKEVEDARLGATGQDIVDMMAGLGEEDPLATKGVFRHPADEAPQPATQGGVTAIRFGRDQWGQATEEEVRQDQLQLEGDAYPDGAHYPHPVKDLGRAGWAIVAFDNMGNKVGEIRGPVWAPLPQSPQSAEYLAISATAGNMMDSIALFPDCMNVVKDFNRPFQEQLSAKRRYAGLMKEAQGHENWCKAAEATWQKAHLQLDSLQGEELIRAIGNDEADRSAKQAARESHPPIPEALDEQARRQDGWAKAFCKVASAVLRRFPMESIMAPRLANEAKTAMRAAGGHRWIPFRGGLRCAHCLATAAAREAREERDRHPCSGLPPAMARVARNPKGHECIMLRYASHVPGVGGAPAMLMCISCGGWTSKDTRSLAKPCLKPLEMKRRAKDCMRRVQKGRHPTKDIDLDGLTAASRGWFDAKIASEARQHKVPVRRRRPAHAEEQAPALEPGMGSQGPRKDSVLRAMVAEPAAAPAAASSNHGGHGPGAGGPAEMGPASGPADAGTAGTVRGRRRAKGPPA